MEKEGIIEEVEKKLPSKKQILSFVSTICWLILTFITVWDFLLSKNMISGVMAIFLIAIGLFLAHIKLIRIPGGFEIQMYPQDEFNAQIKSEKEELEISERKFLKRVK